MHEIKVGLLRLIVQAINDESLINKRFMKEIEGIYFSLSQDKNVHIQDISPSLTKLRILWYLKQLEENKLNNTEKKNVFKDLNELLLVLKELDLRNYNDLLSRFYNLR